MAPRINAVCRCTCSWSHRQFHRRCPSSMWATQARPWSVIRILRHYVQSLRLEFFSRKPTRTENIILCLSISFSHILQLQLAYHWIPFVAGWISVMRRYLQALCLQIEIQVRATHSWWAGIPGNKPCNFLFNLVGVQAIRTCGWSSWLMLD